MGGKQMKEFLLVIIENNFLQTVFGTLLGVVVGHYLASRFQRKMLEQQLEAQKASQEELQAHIKNITDEMATRLLPSLMSIAAQGNRNNVHIS
jgi:cell division protein FtsB